MKRFNKVELNFLEQKEQLSSLLWKLGLFAGSVIILYFISIKTESDMAQNKNSIKTPVSATFAWYGRRPFSSFCFFKVNVVGTVPARCTNDYYYVGQEVELNKVTKPSGDYFYEIPGETF